MCVRRSTTKGRQGEGGREVAKEEDDKRQVIVTRKKAGHKEEKEDCSMEVVAGTR